MNKSDLILAIYRECSVYKVNDVAIILECVINFLEDELTKKNGLIEIRGFGKFEVAVQTKRKARNPQNGQIIDVQEKNKIKFKPSKSLLDKLNNKL
jgi:nucleoid DNA-binding protein